MSRSKSEAKRLKVQTDAQQERAIEEGVDLEAEGCGCCTDQELAIMKRSQPSVELKQDAKGGVSFTIKVYDDDPEAAAETAKKVFDDLNSKFKL